MKSLFVLLLCVFAVSGADLEITNWIVPPDSDPYYPNMDADVGDTITFTWTGRYRQNKTFGIDIR